jgi:hypothetical protein
MELSSATPAGLPALKENLMRSRIFAFLTLAVLASSMVFAQDQYTAYSVYTYDKCSTSNPCPNGRGMAGRIVDAGGSSVTASPDMSPTATDKFTWNGDPIVQGFANSSNVPTIAVTDYTGTAGQPIRIYNATNGSLDTTVTNGWSSVTNPYSLVTVGNYLYAIDYDSATVAEINPSTYAQTSSTPYTAPSVTVGNYTYKAYGQGLLNVNGTLYGLFFYYVYNSSTKTFTYYDSWLVKFNINPGSSIVLNSVNPSFAANGFALASTTINGTPYIYVASLGGQQQGSSYNSGSVIQAVKASNITATPTTVLQAGSTYPYNFYGISFNGTTAYVLMGTYTGDFASTNGLLVQATAGVNSKNAPTLTVNKTIDTISSQAGYYWAAQFTPNNRLWEARGNEIEVYDVSSSTPVIDATLTLSSGSLLSSTDIAYDNISNISYVDPVEKKTVAVRGYRSPFQVSHSPALAAVRALTQGRPGLTTEEINQLNNESNTK